jgi:hypothetical protein
MARAATQLRSLQLALVAALLVLAFALVASARRVPGHAKAGNGNGRRNLKTLGLLDGLISTGYNNHRYDNDDRTYYRPTVYTPRPYYYNNYAQPSYGYGYGGNSGGGWTNYGNGGSYYGPGYGNSGYGNGGWGYSGWGRK